MKMLSMSTMPWTADQLHHARLCAINLLCDGETPADVAAALEVSVRSVQRWAAAWGSAGEAALLPKPRPGRPAKLADGQVQQVLGWIVDSPTHFGFSTERWTAPRVAALIQRRFGVRMNPRYLNDWLRRRGGITPQVPERRAYERDPERIDAWITRQWPRVKKRLATAAPLWFLRTRAASC